MYISHLSESSDRSVKPYSASKERNQPRSTNSPIPKYNQKFNWNSTGNLENKYDRFLIFTFKCLLPV